MQAKRRTTKEIILDEAGILFMDKGFQATSTREIAERAGITQPNLYHHFKTKEDIYIAVLERLSAEIKEGLEYIIQTDGHSLYESLVNILDYLREKHPANFSIMRHDMTYEISPKNHQHLYEIWQVSYLRPLVSLFEYHHKEEMVFSPRELTRYFYSSMAPFIQKDNPFFKEISSRKAVYLFVYGILDKEEKEC